MPLPLPLPGWKRALVLLVMLVVAACDQTKDKPQASSKEPESAASLIASLDAGPEPSDPPPPAGDLKQDLDRFVNLDQCVAERSKVDPLLGDALGAIGYDTFVRDACRLLEATKDKKTEDCDRIDSSALRGRCKSWVAIASESADVCPLQFEALATRGRSPTCVAIASKDPRLCVGEPRAAPRATCEAMVAREPAKCDGLAPSHRASCRREVARWRSLLPAPLEGLDKLPPARGKVVVHGASGTSDPVVTEADLASDFERGAVVVTSRGRMRIELGTVAESESARLAVSPQKRPRVGVAVVFAETPSLEKLELELPGEPLMVSPPAACSCKLTRSRASDKRGGEVVIALEGTVTSGSRSYAISLDLATFVRDVVPEESANRVLPPIHPALGRPSAPAPSKERVTPQ